MVLTLAVSGYRSLRDLVDALASQPSCARYELRTHLGETLVAEVETGAVARPGWAWPPR